MIEEKKCRFCGAVLEAPFLDLGKTPLSNDYLKPSDLAKQQAVFPLRVFLCEECFLVQLADVNTSEHIFDKDYAYYSSYSTSWLKHSKRYTDMMTERFGLNASSFVIEVASNDGYLLQYFKEKEIPVLGIEPSENCAKEASEKGISTWVRFFGVEIATELVRQGKRADLLLGNNVLAHVPDLNDFVEGLRIALKPGGVVTMEFPHLLRLLTEGQFDTIYHEHFSYFSFGVVEKIFAKHGLTLFDVEELSTHGGSLRIYGRHSTNRSLPVSARVVELKEREARSGLNDRKTYQEFAAKVPRVKEMLLLFLNDAKASGKTVAGYGAPAKGNTLLNYCGVGTRLIRYTVDASPHKQNHYLPGSRLPVYAPEKIRQTKPDYVVILPWNIKEEVMNQMSFISEWGGRFVIPMPELRVIDAKTAPASLRLDHDIRLAAVRNVDEEGEKTCLKPVLKI